VDRSVLVHEQGLLFVETEFEAEHLRLAHLHHPLAIEACGSSAELKAMGEPDAGPRYTARAAVGQHPCAPR
jgi:hypothetical protein